MLEMNFGDGGYDLDQTHSFMHPVAGALGCSPLCRQHPEVPLLTKPQREYPSDRVNLTSYFAI
jgi:hypothetical protein